MAPPQDDVDIAELAFKEFQAKLRAAPRGETSPAPGPREAPRPAETFAHAGMALTKEELLEGMAAEEEQRRQAKGRLMDAAEYRKRQDGGAKPEAAMANRATPLSLDEIMAKYQPQRPDGQTQDEEPEQWRRRCREQVMSEEELQRHRILQELNRSQMPAVAKDDDGALVKTIEHYSFADGEDAASFYVQFDKDLWEGASKFVEVGQVQIDSKPNSLEIRLLGIPVSERALDRLAEWRLSLSPLFSRVEPAMTTWKVKGGKLVVKLAKSKTGAWKKGVKY